MTIDFQPFVIETAICGSGFVTGVTRLVLHAGDDA